MPDFDDEPSDNFDDLGDGSPPPPDGPAETGLLAAPPPAAIADLAEACVRFVERAVGVKLDYTPETLPLLDYWLEGARAVLRDPPPRESETEGEPDPSRSLELVRQSAGAYLGEVIRRRHASWWRLGGPDAEEHRLEFHRVSLVVYPVAMVTDAVVLDPSKDVTLTGFDLDEDDRAAAAARLAELPEVTVEDFVRPSTRLEVLDIVVDSARTRHRGAGVPDLELEPEDYVN